MRVVLVCNRVRRTNMSRNDLIELAGTLQAMRVYLMEQGARYKPAADALIDVLVELQRAAQWRDWELRRIGRVAAELTRARVAGCACAGHVGRCDMIVACSSCAACRVRA